MLLKYQILVLLPVITYSHITVMIKAGQNNAETSLDSYGESRQVISDTDRKTFQLNDEALKKATEKYKGKRCTDVYLRAPTPKGDVYYENEFNEVETVLKPTAWRIVNVTSERVTLATASYSNHHNARHTNYRAKVMKEVIEKLTHAWKSPKPLTVGDDTIYKVKFEQGNVGGINTLHYVSPYGVNNTESRSVVLGATSESILKVPPGEGVSESLSVIKGVMKVEIDYQATLAGDVFCNYSKKYEGRNIYAFDIKEILKAGKFPQKIDATEKINVIFYSNVRTIIYNLTNKNPLQETHGGIVRVDEIEVT